MITIPLYSWTSCSHRVHILVWVGQDGDLRASLVGWKCLDPTPVSLTYCAPNWSGLMALYGQTTGSERTEVLWVWVWLLGTTKCSVNANDIPAQHHFNNTHKDRPITTSRSVELTRPELAAVANYVLLTGDCIYILQFKVIQGHRLSHKSKACIIWSLSRPAYEILHSKRSRKPPHTLSQSIEGNPSNFVIKRTSPTVDTFHYFFGVNCVIL